MAGTQAARQYFGCQDIGRSHGNETDRHGRLSLGCDQTIDRLAHETRDFTCCMYGTYVQQGIDGESERVVEPYLDYARNLFQSHPLLYDGNLSDIVPGIMRAYLIRDDGIVVLPYGNPASRYTGLRFIVRVEGLNEVIYGNE